MTEQKQHADWSVAIPNCRSDKGTLLEKQRGRHRSDARNYRVDYSYSIWHMGSLVFCLWLVVLKFQLVNLVNITTKLVTRLRFLWFTQLPRHYGHSLMASCLNYFNQYQFFPSWFPCFIMTRATLFPLTIMFISVQILTIEPLLEVL